MKKKYLILSSLICLILNFTYCQKGAYISGNIKGLDLNSKLYLFPKSNRQQVDSFLVQTDSFYFKITPLVGDVYFLFGKSYSKNFVVPVYINNGAIINLNSENIFITQKTTGSKIANEQNDFSQGLYPYIRSEKELKERLEILKDTVLYKKLNQQLNKLYSDKFEYEIKFITEHKDSPFSAVVIYMYLNTDDNWVKKKLLDYLSPLAKENNCIVDFINKDYIKVLNGLSPRLEYKAPNIKVKDTLGNDLELFSIKQKYILLDFWASWCDLCRKNNPILNKLYRKFKELSFTILSISIDKDKESWKDAIIKDNMKWLQGSDLLGGSYGVALQYNIKNVPTYFLLSDFKIIKIATGSLNSIELELDNLFKN